MIVVCVTVNRVFSRRTAIRWSTDLAKVRHMQDIRRVCS